MAKGFLKGALWGACVSLGGVTIISVAADGPKQLGQQQVRTGQSATQSSIVETESADRSAGLRAPAVPPDTLTGLAPDIDAPAAVPVTGFATELAATEFAEPVAGDGLAALNQPAPQVRSAQSGSLTTPLSDPEASISTVPAQPPLPSAAVPQTAFDAPEPVQPAPGDTDAQTAALSPQEISEGPTQPNAPEEPVETAAVVPTETAQLQNAPEAVDTTNVEPVETSPAAMTEGPQISLSLDDPQTAEPGLVSTTPAPTEQAVDATPPILSTNVEQPETLASGDIETTEPDVTTEAQAPLVAAVEDIEAPTSTDNAQAAGESETAAVQANVTTTPLTDVPTPEIIGEPSLPIASADIPAVPDAPASVSPVTPDPVATPDLARFVASDQAADAPSGQVRVNRLPSLGQEAPTDPIADPDNAEGPSDDIVAVETPLTPFERYAVPFDATDGKPAMAIVLMDQGQDLAAEKIGLPALRSFPYPLTFAVDAMLEDAADRIAAYRAEGFEVLAIVDLPEGATATDAEVNMAVALQRVPEVVGVLEGVKTGVQTTRDSGRQVAQILAQSGHGFVTQNVGLNTVQKLAEREGVPSAFVFRDFDAKGQSPTVIRRFLDQAAFKAAQEGGVVMLGRLREETISALLVWGLQDRASRVALAPVSAVLSKTPE